MMRKGHLSNRLYDFAAGVALAIAVMTADRAAAEITDSASNGFTVRETAHIAASNDKVYAALIAPQHWWSSHHTFSGDAANLSFDAKAGGCWCETIPGGGSVLHMTIVYAVPGKTLRLRGALGPFQTMPVEEVMIWSLTPVGDGTDVTLVNAYGGYTKDGFDKISHVVDSVMGEQIGRLKAYVETGSPESSVETQERKP
jgi:uncharacterized protein YndB with AHSA1/START domain